MTHPSRPRRLLAFYVLQLAVVYTVFASLVGGLVAFEARGGGATIVDATCVGVYAAVLPFSKDPPDWYDALATGWRGSWKACPWDFSERYYSDALDLRELRSMLLTGRMSRYFLGQTILAPVAFLVVPLLTMLGAPLGFVALPISRRRAKVRWGHITRITAYSLAPLVPLLLYAVVRFRFVEENWAVMEWTDFDPLFREMWHLCIWVVPLWLVLWWAMAIRFYLKMPHAWSIGAAIVIIGLLIGPAFVLMIWSALAMLAGG